MVYGLWYHFVTSSYVRGGHFFKSLTFSKTKVKFCSIGDPNENKFWDGNGVLNGFLRFRRFFRHQSRNHVTYCHTLVQVQVKVED